MADIDVKYLRDKGVPQLLEGIAADIASQKPADPEAFLRARFAGGSAGGVSAGEEVKLYANQLDPGCAMALVAAAYARVAVVYSEVDVSKNQHITPEFGRLSPFHQVPVLDHNGVVLADAGAVTRYLCSGTPATPQGARERAKVDAAFEAIRTHVLPAATAAAQETVLLPARNHRPIDQHALQAHVESTRSALRTVATAYFKDSTWVVGKDFSLADIALAAVAFTMKNTVGVDCFGEGSLKLWFDAVQREPSYAQGLKDYMAAAAAAAR